MELKETINIYEIYQDKLNELWRSLWPGKQKTNHQKIRTGNSWAKFLEWQKT